MMLRYSISHVRSCFLYESVKVIRLEGVPLKVIRKMESMDGDDIR